MIKVGILNLGYGNLKAIINAINYAGIKKITLINNTNQLRNINRIIIPGHGNISTIKYKISYIELLNKIQHTLIPTLGICLGMQILHGFNKEGNIHGTCILPYTVKKLKVNKIYKTPNIGWQKIEILKKNNYINHSQYFYFSHTYYSEVIPNTIATIFHMQKISAMIIKDNFIGTQFHPEKSGYNGIKLLKKFIFQQCN
ncbi:imidazole glycerol phosphate synthase subunit HisH [Candidatus Vidania fulgoroideae]|nr:imidazole glycerol phosphate synthase subunit HisH [Candidatus Vidania fulgoroideae]